MLLVPGGYHSARLRRLSPRSPQLSHDLFNLALARASYLWIARFRAPTPRLGNYRASCSLPRRLRHPLSNPIYLRYLRKLYTPAAPATVLCTETTPP